jgi:iron(III) transport system substrate-binding protein
MEHGRWTKRVDRQRLVSAFYLLSAILAVSLFVGCDNSQTSTATHTVVLYTSVDEPYARPIIDDFEKANPDIKVTLQTDAEANKTVGLVERIRAEAANPQADVWWGNEPFHSVNLADEGLLVPYESASAGDIPSQFKDAEHRWAGCGVRARVIGVYTGEGKPSVVGLESLTDARLSKKIAMARPTAGTTGSHVAALYVVWGDAKADAFFKQLHDNGIQLLGGNGPVADAVGQGQFLAGLTDNDDVAAAAREGGKIDTILPDQTDLGTLAVPTTVGLVKGAKHSDAAKKLIDFLLTSQTEQRLVDAKFVGWTVRSGADAKVKWMTVDYDAVARKMPDAIRRSTAILEGRGE